MRPKSDKNKSYTFSGKELLSLSSYAQTSVLKARPDLDELFCKSAYSDVRLEVATLTSKVELLSRLHRDRSKAVKEEVAKNSNTPVELLESIFLNSGAELSHGVISALYRNPNFPEQLRSDLLKKMIANHLSGGAHESYSEICHAAENWPSIKELRPLLLSLSWNVRERIAKRSDLEFSDLEIFMKDDDSDVFKAAYSRIKSLPPSERERLYVAASHNEDWSSRHMIAKDPECSKSALSNLIFDEDYDVVEAALSNKSISPGLLASFLQTKEDYGDEGNTMLRKLANNKIKAIIKKTKDPIERERIEREINMISLGIQTSFEAPDLESLDI
jgi:hypothetical protein